MQTDKQTDRQTQNQQNRQTDKQTDTKVTVGQTDRYIFIQIDRQMYKDQLTVEHRQTNGQIERKIDKEFDIWRDMQTVRQAFRSIDC